jgi:hypothetical protein
MALTASQVRVPGTGELFTNAAGTTGPADATAALPVGWTGLGYTQEDGATIGRSLDREPITSWQSVTPLAYIYNGAELTIAAAMLQSNNEIASLWFGGGDFAETVVGSGEFKSDMPTIPEGVERALVLEWRDVRGATDVVSRLYIPRAELRETGEVQLSRTGPTAFQMTWAALAPDTGSVLATWLTNDPAFAPAA